MKQFFLLCFLFMGLAVSAQTTFIKVVDAGSKEPLPRSTILFSDSSRRFTDDQGFCRVVLSLPVTARISYIGYETQLITLKKFKQDTIIVKLVRDKQLLDEVKVLPELPEYIFFGSPDLQVIDYEFMDQYLLVGVYHNYKRSCSLLVLDSNHKIIDEQPLPADFERFYVSGIYRYYAVSGIVIHELQLRRNILTRKQINNAFFYDKVIYYKGFYKDYLYIMEPHVSKQAHLYYVEHVQEPENTIRPMAILGNQHTYNSYKSDMELNKLYKKAEVHKLYELIGSSASDEYYQAETKEEFGRMAYFDVRYKDVYSQLFVADSLVYVFDFIEDNLILFSPEGKELRLASISFHRLPGWKPFVQRSGSDYYTVYESGEHLQVAKLRSDFSGIEKRQSLFHPKPQQWKIQRKYVYYLYSPPGYPRNTFLFREALQ